MATTCTRPHSFLSITIDDLGHDPLPYVDPATGERMARPRYNPVNVYSPRPEHTRTTTLPLSTAMATFRRIWREQVSSGAEYPAMVAHDLAAMTAADAWGEGAKPAEIEHARKVAGKLARCLSDGVLVSL